MKTNDFKSKTRISIVIMKMFVVMAMFILSYSSLYAQKCNLKTIKDEYASPPSISVVSEDVTLGGAFRVLGDALPWHLDMKFFLDDGQLSILITHHQSRLETTSLLNSIFFVFKDGTVIRKEEPIGSNDFSAAGTLTGFVLTKEELQFFASKDLMKFKVEFKYFPERPIFENELKQKSIDIIRKDASCMLTEINKTSGNKKDAKNDITDKADYNYTCNYLINNTDDFTKTRVVLTGGALLFSVYYQKNNETQAFAVKGSYNGVKGLEFVRGDVTTLARLDVEDLKSKLIFDEVELLLENDESINLKTSEASEFMNKSPAFLATKRFIFDSDSIYQKLKTSPLKKIRLSLNGKPTLTCEIEPKYSKSIMNVIDCIDVVNVPKSK